MFEDQEVVAEFVNESREHLAEIESQLLGIEEAGAGADPALVNEVFRAVHSIKGAAGFMGFVTLGKLAHELENVLNLMRNGQLVADSSAIDTMLKAADKLRWMIDNIERSNETDVSDHLTALEQIVVGLIETDSPATQSPAMQIPAAEPLAKTQVAEEVKAGESNAEPLAEAVKEAAEAAVKPQAVEAVEVKAKARPANPTEAHVASPATDTSIRVGVGVLDKLMTLAGELVLSRNQLLQTLSLKDLTKFEAVSARVDQVTTDLHETVMQARMQVVGTVFNRFPRVVRDLSAQLGKQCELRIEGAEVELDKSIIEAIGDPLTHLVRNAVDHGVELPPQRQAAGKPAKATVVLRAFHQAGKVNISISDDGGGIDVARLKQKAVTRGLLSPDQARSMNEREALALIFRPGFSTVEKVTDVSGRGVGMDVVKTNIERVGGSVSVETEIGVGTTVLVKLPLTLAIIPCLIVHSSGNRYAIPQSSICELVRVKRKETATRIQRMKNAEVLRLRGTLLPLVRLETVLGFTPADGAKPQSAQNIVVAEAGHMRFGLVVDGLHDSEEIVVKPLGRHMRNCSYLAGATILGDGQAALILDPAGIAAFSKLRAPEEETCGATNENAVVAKGDVQTLLLFRNDPAEQFAIPMHLVARLERIRTMQIDSVGGSKVLQYRGGSLPLLSLEEFIATRPMPETNWLYVVVFSLGGREVGLLIREVIDIHTTGAAIDGTIFRQPGVMGSMVLEGKTTRLLDLHELTAAAHPEWVVRNEAAAAGGSRSETILLAEDSDFFRQRITDVFESAGYRVVACPDGEAAWQAIQDPEQTFDMVVTDLEMPRVDGFELTRRIRQHPPVAQLPVFAVTSLASEEDQQRARQAGVNEYHIKLDREALVDAVTAEMRKAKSEQRQPQA
ncbi:MAG: chemotaxis protein CheW [Thermoguttaceae bacterium]